MIAPETIVGYQVAEETDGGVRKTMHATTENGDDAMLFFVTRERAEKYCMVIGISRPWPIDALTLLELKAIAHMCREQGTRYVCVDPFGARGNCVEIAAFLDVLEKA
jgi:hypothetical protein